MPYARNKARVSRNSEFATRGHSTKRSPIRAALPAPYLDRGEERDLAVRWRELCDQEALDRIAFAHMRLVISIAMKFRRFRLPLDDLIQEGHIGLLEAAARFEPQRELRFSTYAKWWINASIQDYVLRNWSIVRGGTSSKQKALFFKLRWLRARLAQGSQTLSGDSVYREISSALGVPLSDVAMMDWRLSAPDVSLNAPLAEDDAGSPDRLAFLVSDGPLPDELAEQAIDFKRRSLRLYEALRVLNARELLIIRERWLRDDSAMLKSLGETMGISKARVLQIERRAMEKLKSALVKANPAFTANTPVPDNDHSRDSDEAIPCRPVVGRSLRYIAADKAGVQTPPGGQWSATQVMRALERMCAPTRSR